MRDCLKFKMMEISRMENNSIERKIKTENKELVKAVNSLQFALDQQESTLMDSQETWARRFDRVCNDNAKLLSAFEERSEELRKIVSQKMAVTRERDELLSLLDVQEKIKYDRSRSSPDDNYRTFSSSELATLGACICRGQKSEPCGCAYSAANMHREILKLREEVEMHYQQWQDAYLLADAYRYAFEEQLLSSRQMVKCINELSAGKSSKTTKNKKIPGRYIWKKEPELGPDASIVQEVNQSISNIEPVSEIPQMFQHLAMAKLKQLDITSLRSPHLGSVLLEMLQEKCEILAYQKLAARILANKVKTLESGQTAVDSKDKDNEGQSEQQSKCCSLEQSTVSSIIADKYL